MSPDVLTKCFAFLTSLRLANAPSSPEDIEAAAEAWRMVLDDLTDDDLRTSVRLHLRNPERGRWWPTPADLLGHVKPPERQADPPEVLWDRVMERVRDPRHRNQDGSGKVDFEGVLTPEQQGILRSVGGSAAIRMANDYELTRIRAAFLRALRDKGKTLPALRLVGGE